MTLVTHFQKLARYNRTANERLFAKCAQLDDAEYRQQRAGSFGSIHALLNHILFGDRRWIGLFESGERVTPPLNQILYNDLVDLRTAREREDVRIESFFAGLDDAFFSRSFAYTNNQGKRLRGDGTRSMHAPVQSPGPPSRTGPRNAESDSGGTPIARLAPDHQSLGQPTSHLPALSLAPHHLRAARRARRADNRMKMDVPHMH